MPFSFHHTGSWTCSPAHRPTLVGRRALAKRSSCIVALFILLSCSLTSAAEPLDSRSTATNAPIKEISPGIFQIGLVRLDKPQRTITLPAALNMNDGLLEYLLVTRTGKTHESLLRTEVEPYHVQVALLLLGAKGTPPAALTNMPPGGQIIGNKDGPDKFPPPPGDPVSISVSWTEHGKPRASPIEDLVYNLHTKSAMTRGDFTFTGSRLWEGTFIAQREGSIITTITDPDAIINNPRPGRENDEIWQVATKAVPATNTAVIVTITIKNKAAK